MNPTYQYSAYAETPVAPAIEETSVAPAPVNTMNAADLAGTSSAYKTYTPPPATAADGIAESAIALKDAYIAKTAKEAADLEKSQGKDRKNQKSILDKIGGMFGKKTEEYDKEGGVNDQREAIDELSNQIDARTRAYDKQIQALEKNAEGRFGGGMEIEVNRLKQQKASELADLSIVLTAKNRNYETAKSIIDQKVDAETEQLKFQFDAAKYFYDQNESKLTDKQKTIAQERMDAAEREYTEGRDQRKQIADLQLEAAINGAPVSVVRAIGQTQSFEDAVVSAGQFVRAPEKPSSGTGFNMYTDEDMRETVQASLSGASERTKQVFLNTAPSFRQEYIRKGLGNQATTPEEILAAYEKWEAENEDDSSNFNALLDKLEGAGS